MELHSSTVSPEKPPLRPIPFGVPAQFRNERNHDGRIDVCKLESSSGNMKTSKQGSLPPKRARKKFVVDDNVLASPETPEHARHITASGTNEDLSLADVASFEALFQGSAQPYPDADYSRSTFFANQYPEKHEEKKAPNSFCVPSTTFFRRKKKLASVDVASVGNASDTLVSISSRTHMSGRDIHEKAKMYFNDADYKNALPLFEAILSAQVRRFSPLHPSVGAAMHNVGVCRQRMRQYNLAENLFSEAVLIRQQTLGRDHLEVASSLSKLGSTRIALQKFDEAHDNLFEALRIARFALGAQHKTVAQMLGNLGCFYFEVGELYASQATFQEALDIYRCIFPREEDRDACMAQLTDTLCNIGSIQNRRKRYTKAIDSFSEALDLQRGIFEHDDPRVIATLDNLGYSYSKNKDYASALSCYRKLLRAQVSRSGTFTEECFESFRKQLLMFEKLNRVLDAINETKEIIQLQKSMLRADHVLITKTKELLKNLHKKKERLGNEKTNS